METNWHLKLYEKSVLKQEKFHGIQSMLPPTSGLTCFDLGGDNGVISYLLRQNGGNWSSADLEESAVESIRGLVKDQVLQVDGQHIPFPDREFDTIVIIDFLEHIHTDREFVQEIKRVLKPGGTLVANVPHVKRFSLIRFIRDLVGLTDEQHGHVRPGYTLEDLQDLFGENLHIEAHRTYSKFFSELIDILISLPYTLLNKGTESKKGVLVTEGEMKKFKKMFRIYSLIYPFLWAFSKLDALLFSSPGHRLIVRAKLKEAES